MAAGLGSKAASEALLACGLLVAEPGMALEAKWGVGSSSAQGSHTHHAGAWASCSFSTCLACLTLQTGQSCITLSPRTVSCPQLLVWISSPLLGGSFYYRDWEASGADKPFGTIHCPGLMANSKEQCLELSLWKSTENTGKRSCPGSSSTVRRKGTLRTGKQLSGRQVAQVE